MLWVILFALIVIGWMLATYTSGQPRRQNGKRSTSGTSASERQLRRRVGSSTAERLINHVAQKHPDLSRAWCADKALHELKRDYRG